jgi:hypothetical protein
MKRMVFSPPRTTRQRQNASSAMGHLVLVGALASSPLLAISAQAHMRGMYATKAEAEKRAAELKCKGTHAMGTMWMPCANERALHDALQKAQ